MSDFIVVPEGKFDIPKVLYKYRDWSNKYHKTILTKREVFFAPPESFEDNEDCRVPIRYDLLTDEEIFNRYLERVSNEHPKWTNLRKRAEARFWFNKGLLRDEKHLKEVDEFSWEDLNKRFGVLSLTANNSSEEMWMKYAANKRGICVGFDTELMFDDKSKVGGGGNVIYFDEFPIIHPLEEPIQKMLKQIYFKKKEWNFEEEYRVHKIHPKYINNRKRIYSVPEEAIAEVILGVNMKSQEREDIIKVVNENCRYAKIIELN